MPNDNGTNEPELSGLAGQPTAAEEVGAQDGSPVKDQRISQDTENEIALFGNRVGGWVLGVCAALVGALVLLLHLQTTALNADPAMISLSSCSTYFENGNCQTSLSIVDTLKQSGINEEQAAYIALEYDAQFLRTKRAQSLVSSRLFIQAIALLAGVSQITMGAAFIFARIRSSNANEITAEWAERQKIVIKSLYPGVILCAFGVTIILAALVASDRTKFVTTDLPVYTDWSTGLSDHMKQEDARKMTHENLKIMLKNGWVPDPNAETQNGMTQQNVGAPNGPSKATCLSYPDAPGCPAVSTPADGEAIVLSPEEKDLPLPEVPSVIEEE